jgi:hypothetical protein
MSKTIYAIIATGMVIVAALSFLAGVQFSQPNASDEEKARREATMFCAQLEQLGGASQPEVLNNCIEERTAYMLDYLRGVDEGP